ncbi:hypothetical protein IFR05_006577 [Cadophora sp. M221]|nr:hypothetical protein IFR05_006577 [Cadophora sp. M221]
MASLSSLETAPSAPAEPQLTALTSTSSAVDDRDRDNDSHSGDVNEDNPVAFADASIHQDSSTIAAAYRDYRREPFWRTSASPFARLRDPPPPPTPHPQPVPTAHLGNPDSQYQYFFIDLKLCVCRSAKGKNHHFRECAIRTQPLINPFTRKLQPCLNCDSFCHSTYACLEPLKAGLITWHTEDTFPSGFGCLEFAKDIYPGHYEITAEEWALLKRGLDPVDERAKGTAKKELAATALGSIGISSAQSQGGTQVGEGVGPAVRAPDINTKQSAPQSQEGLKSRFLVASAVRVPSSLDALVPGPNEYTLETLKFPILPPHPRTVAASAHRYYPQFAQSLHDEILKQKANVPDGRVEQSTSLAAILYPGYVPSAGWASSNTPTGPLPVTAYPRPSGSGLNDLDPRHQFGPEPYLGLRSGPEYHLAHSTQARYLDDRHFVAAPPSASPPSQKLVLLPGCGYTSPQSSTPQGFDTAQSFGALVPCYPPTGPNQSALQQDFIRSSALVPTTRVYSHPQVSTTPASYSPVPPASNRLPHNFVAVPSRPEFSSAAPPPQNSVPSGQVFPNQPYNPNLDLLYTASPGGQSFAGPSTASPQGSRFSQGPSSLSYSPAPEGFDPGPPRQHPGPYSPTFPQAAFEGPVPQSFAPTTPTQVLNSSEVGKRPRTQLPENAAPKPKRQRRTTDPTEPKAPPKLRALKPKPVTKLQSLLQESRLEAHSLAVSATAAYQYLGASTGGSTLNQLPNFVDQFDPSTHPQAYLWTPAAPAAAASSSSAASSRQGSTVLQSSRESSQQLSSQGLASTPATSRGPTPTSRRSQDPPSFLSVLDPALFKE